MKSAAIIALSAHAARAAVPADAVASLPGFAGALPSALYSGYLSAGAGKQAHYMFTASLNAPSTDPVVSWYNGGPGCSSMEGGMSESGLYRIDQFSDPRAYNTRMPRPPCCARNCNPNKPPKPQPTARPRPYTKQPP